MAHHGGTQSSEDNCATISENKDPLQLSQEGPESADLENLGITASGDASEEMQSKWMRCLKCILVYDTVFS